MAQGTKISKAKRKPPRRFYTKLRPANPRTPEPYCVKLKPGMYVETIVDNEGPVYAVVLTASAHGVKVQVIDPTWIRRNSQKRSIVVLPLGDVCAMASPPSWLFGKAGMERERHNREVEARWVKDRPELAGRYGPIESNGGALAKSA